MDPGLNNLTVLALPDKVGVAPAAAHLVLLEPGNADGVGVRLAA